MTHSSPENSIEPGQEVATNLSCPIDSRPRDYYGDEKRTGYERYVPRPYILGPQTYTDPDSWRPPGIEEPLTMNRRYRETLEFLEDMDRLVDGVEPRESNLRMMLRRICGAAKGMR